MGADLNGSNMVLACSEITSYSDQDKRVLARSRSESGSCSTFVVFPYQHSSGAPALAVHNRSTNPHQLLGKHWIQVLAV
jgi:hypothetical protein